MFLLDSFRLSEVLILSGKEFLLLNKLTYGDRMSSYFASRDPRYYWASINFSLSLAWCTRDQASHLPTQLLRLVQDEQNLRGTCPNGKLKFKYGIQQVGILQRRGVKFNPLTSLTVPFTRNFHTRKNVFLLWIISDF